MRTTIFALSEDKLVSAVNQFIYAVGVDNVQEISYPCSDAGMPEATITYGGKQDGMEN